MNKFIQKFKEGIYLGAGFLSIVGLCGIIYATGAWTTTSPTTITGDTSLYSNAGNSLTAAKWNEVVNKVNNSIVSIPQWVSIDLNDITTTYDKGCMRRRERVNNADSCTGTTGGMRYVDFISRDLTGIRYVEGATNYRVLYTNKKAMCAGGTTCTRKVCKLEKLCTN